MRKTWTLVKKEILDILRDKKTLVIMVAVPILLYPAIIIGMVLVMNFMMQSREGGSYTAAYAKQNKAEALRFQEVYEEKKEELDISLTFLEVPETEKGDGKSSYDVWINFVTDGQGLHIEVDHEQVYCGFHIFLHHGCTVTAFAWRICDVFTGKRYGGSIGGNPTYRAGGFYGVDPASFTGGDRDGTAGHCIFHVLLCLCQKL